MSLSVIDYVSSEIIAFWFCCYISASSSTSSMIVGDLDALISKLIFNGLSSLIDTAFVWSFVCC